MTRTALALAFLLASLPLLASDPPASPDLLAIQDNSFLVEEAYNQEDHVVQHIFTWSRSRGGDYDATFTQEWPAGGLRHQLSYTATLQRAGEARGAGDALINYRYQLAGDGGSRLAIAPRASVILPTGDRSRGLGSGGYGFQLQLPLSYVVAPRVITHWNAGVTKIPSSRDAAVWTAGGSIISAPSKRVHLMFETLWSSGGDAPRVTFSPGVRWAYDFTSGLQIVPGVAAPIGSDGSRAVFLYLSFEHPFGR